MISYDLAAGRDYAAFHEKIEKFGTWVRITESTWAVVSERSAAQIRDHLGALMQPGDRLFVVRFGGEAAWRNAKCSNEWLKKHITAP